MQRETIAKQPFYSDLEQLLAVKIVLFVFFIYICYIQMLSLRAQS